MNSNNDLINNSIKFKINFKIYDSWYEREISSHNQIYPFPFFFYSLKKKKLERGFFFYKLKGEGGALHQASGPAFLLSSSALTLAFTTSVAPVSRETKKGEKSRVFRAISRVSGPFLSPSKGGGFSFLLGPPIGF